ncbi:transposase [Virgibacillus profundi]|uniref:transposase n=1 Tax=Virgibacillus profundi TaxID=2024555 RepID=UPI00197FE4B7|nr:transposase [Virgibacillus profundi]
MITRMQLDPDGYFETYLKLTKEEEEQLMAEVEKLPEAEKIMEIPISYEEKGKEIGEAIGVKKVAIEMLKKGLNMDLIVEVTHMDIEEIKELKEQL